MVLRTASHLANTKHEEIKGSPEALQPVPERGPSASARGCSPFHLLILCAAMDKDAGP